jgi:parallel beta-helix repeat protein
LYVTGHDVRIEGVVMNGFLADASQNGGEAIVFEGGSGGSVFNSAIGTNRARTAVVANGGPGIRIVDSSFNRIANNLITGNAVGIQIEGNSDSNSLQVNTIGAVSGSGLTGNVGHGVAILAGDDNRLEYTGVCTNLCPSGQIVGNGGSGVYIGPDAVGTFVGAHEIGRPGSGNGGHGVEVQGGQASLIVAGIFGNAGAGVFVGSGSGNTIQAATSSNNGLGIDLAPTGITPNDIGDFDGGPNGLQNFPILSSASLGPGLAVTLTGMLQSASSSPYVLEFYASSSCDTSGNGEGEHFIGSTNVTTDAAGNAPFNVVLDPVSYLPGGAITATATDAAGSTSEHSPCVFAPLPVVTAIQPDSGPDTGGTAVEILGQNFDPASTVRIGDADALNVVVTSPMLIDADTPALPPGTLNHVTVTDSNGRDALLAWAWLSNFLDVPEDHLFHDFVETIFREFVTAGCGFGLYCVDQAVPREQMAVFLLRSKFGPTYTPPPATGMVFPNDVPADGFAADYIEALHALEITAGCAPGSFCPDDPVTRAQMSVFLLTTLEGPAYNPPPETGLHFTDVPVGSFAAAWIEELFERGITAGCDVALFCPDASTTRGQMAVFLVETFGL